MTSLPISGQETRTAASRASRTFADLLFAAGHSEEALAALMLAADVTIPQPFEIVLPQLAIERDGTERGGMFWENSRYTISTTTDPSDLMDDITADECLDYFNPCQQDRLIATDSAICSEMDPRSGTG